MEVPNTDDLRACLDMGVGVEGVERTEIQRLKMVSRVMSETLPLIYL